MIILLIIILTYKRKKINSIFRNIFDFYLFNMNNNDRNDYNEINK